MVQKYHQNDSLLRGQLQGSVSVRSVEVLTYQWHHWGSVHLAIFDHLWMFDRGDRQRRWKNFRKERKGVNDYVNLVFTYIIFNMRDMAISPKYNFDKLLRKLTISDCY